MSLKKGSELDQKSRAACVFGWRLMLDWRGSKRLSRHCVSPVLRKVSYEGYGLYTFPELKTMPKSMSFTVCGAVEFGPAMTNVGTE